MQKNWVRKGLVCGIIVLFVGASVVPISCANERCEVYVDDDNTGQEDGSWLFPYNTITEGIENVCEGGFVYVGNGSYNECIVIKKPLTLKKTDKVFPGNKQNYLIIDGGGNDSVIKIEYCQQYNVTIDGFDIRNSRHTTDDAGIFITGSYNCHILNNDLNNNYNGIIIKDSTLIEINENRIHINQKNGIQVYGKSSDIIIKNNNKIYDCEENGILCSSEIQESNIQIILNNSIFSCKYDGIHIDPDSSGIKINHNTIYDCGIRAPLKDYGNGIKIDNSQKIYIENNDIINTTSGISITSGSSEILIEYNNISECYDNGICINGVWVMAQCYHNDIYKNGLNQKYGAGFIIEGNDNKNLSINNNYIHENEINIVVSHSTSFYNMDHFTENNITEPVKWQFWAFLCFIVHAEHNYWGDVFPLRDFIQSLFKGSIFRIHPCSDHPWSW